MTTRLVPYLVLNGNTKEAIQFYEQALDAKLLFMQSFGEMPENPEFPIPAELKDRVGHAMLKVGETELMLSDTFPGQPHHQGNQVTICIVNKDKNASSKIYEAIKQDGQVIMELQETHFSPAYGSVVDKFGITFQIFTEGQF